VGKQTDTKRKRKILSQAGNDGTTIMSIGYLKNHGNQEISKRMWYSKITWWLRKDNARSREANTHGALLPTPSIF
jgi:hypothetical protein